MSAPVLFTAAEIAHCLNCTPQNVRKTLDGIRPDGKKIVSGVETAAWRFDSLPSPLLVRLAKRARRHGYTTPLQYLQNAPRSEKPLPSVAQVADEEIERAQKLQRALSRCLAPDELPTAERARIAREDFQHEFGRAVGDRHLRRLIERTIARDRGDKNFARLNLYLADRSAVRRVRPSPLAASFRFDGLDVVFATIRDRARPTLGEIAYCWREVLNLWSERLTTGADEIKLKRELRGYLLQTAPFMGGSEEAIKRNLNRKIREAIEHGIGAIADGRLRPARIGRKPSDFDAMIKLLAQHSILHCGRREAQAYRELFMGTTHTGERFSEEFRMAYPFDCRTAKSRMPHSVRNAARPLIEAMKAIHLGPRAARLAMPSIRRDWSEVLAGASYTSDDVTLNHYLVDWHGEGEYEFDGRRFNIVRPQFLPVVDERTGNPLGFSLAPSPTYNSRQIRTLIARVCMRPEIGLPFDRFVFEKGIWQSRNVRALSEWAAIDESFVHHGIRLTERHATTPKAKIIEQVIGALQNLDEYAAGYCGRSEQNVKYELLREFLQRLKRAGQPQKAEVDPTEMLMTTEQCADMLSQAMRRFADEPQNGERLAGLSPAEGWEQLSGGRAHHVLPESLRYLLASEESAQTVTNEGISLQIGRFRHHYCGSEQLGALIGEKVRVRFNPEMPELVTVSHIASDPTAQNPFAVPLFEKVRAHDATAEEFSRARADQKRFVSYGRALYRELAPKANVTIRRSDLGSVSLRGAGEAHNRLERESIELSADRDAARGTIDKLAARNNLSIDPAKVRRPARVAKHLSAVDELRAKIRATEAAESSAVSAGVACDALVAVNSDSSSGKVYVLDSPTKPLTPQQRNGMYWRLWKAAEAAQPGLNRFSLTSRVLGRVIKITQMTDEQFLKICRVFETIAKKEQS